MSIGCLAFTCFTLLDPLNAYRNNAMPVLFPSNDFTEKDKLAMLWLGGILMTAYMFFCTQALMAYATTVILYVYHSGSFKPERRWCYCMMLIVLVFTFIGACGELAFGILLRNALGLGMINPPVIVVTNIASYANIVVVTGLLQLANCILLAGIFCVPSLFLPYSKGSAVMLLVWFLSAYTMANIGLGGSVFASTGSIVASLTSVSALAPVFVFFELHKVLGYF